MRKLMVLAAMLAMVLAAAAPALAQDESNTALVNCQQIIQQVGGDQYADATGSGEGDVAAANNQEFTAEQIQQCLAIVGNDNAAGANVGDVTVPAAPAPDGDNGGGSANGGGGGSNGGGGLAVLPDTGGLPLPALLAGIALISCGILARRLAR